MFIILLAHSLHCLPNQQGSRLLNSPFCLLFSTHVGANIAIAEMFETSLQLGGALLKALSVDEHEIMRIIKIFRDRDYALTRGILEVAPELHHTPYGKMLAFQNVVRTEGVVKN